ncbi:Coiled-coil domain-containing protein 50 [Acipenser ruthenus]|uniref:Coiled-coil domain-containing protein 50 n=1 Tax=Acipenser ruthenus TaxID=7906 RepID=A0A444UIW6_ACIRT|nr:Coiled-coil domain-containing protein 50 [Acipenser ruthenus]
MADLSIDQNKLPGVKEVCRDFAVLEDHTLAHNLQEQEIENHLASNIQKSRLVQYDLQVAKRMQDEEDKRAWARNQRHQRDIVHSDNEIAQEIQEQLVKQALDKRQQEEKDEAIARRLHEKELKEERKRKKQLQDVPYEDRYYEDNGDHVRNRHQERGPQESERPHRHRHRHRSRERDPDPQAESRASQSTFYMHDAEPTRAPHHRHELQEPERERDTRRKERPSRPPPPNHSKNHSREHRQERGREIRRDHSKEQRGDHSRDSAPRRSRDASREQRTSESYGASAGLSRRWSGEEHSGREGREDRQRLPSGCDEVFHDPSSRHYTRDARTEPSCRAQERHGTRSHSSEDWPENHPHHRDQRGSCPAIDGEGEETARKVEGSGKGDYGNETTGAGMEGRLDPRVTMKTLMPATETQAPPARLDPPPGLTQHIKAVPTATLCERDQLFCLVLFAVLALGSLVLCCHRSWLTRHNRLVSARTLAVLALNHPDPVYVSESSQCQFPGNQSPCQSAGVPSTSPPAYFNTLGPEPPPPPPYEEAIKTRGF